MYWLLLAYASLALCTAELLYCAPSVSPLVIASDNSTCGTLQNPCATLQYTLTNRSSDNDTIYALPGTHFPPSEGIHLNTTGSISIIGNGSATLDCRSSSSGFIVSECSGVSCQPNLSNSMVTVDGFTVQNCKAATYLLTSSSYEAGGGFYIHTSRSVMLSNMRIVGCQAQYGGGIYIDSPGNSLKPTLNH